MAAAVFEVNRNEVGPMKAGNLEDNSLLARLYIKFGERGVEPIEHHVYTAPFHAAPLANRQVVGTQKS